ncbi:MAG TPA: succinate dehydrogenase, hydrophobic membrane anchor protein [Alcanivoracaceae bacterium]|nr:succinate dehydrogenase, hydrophobic membrane anchor protein [Alcanivoracaceae bacterium]
MPISASVTSLSRNGMADWLLQRISAVVLAVYMIGLMGYLVFASDVSYDSWKALMTSLPMQLANSVVIISIIVHAWVGLWTVTTDYLTRAQFGDAATALRLTVQSLLMLSFLVLTVWGFVVIWGGQ